MDDTPQPPSTGPTLSPVDPSGGSTTQTLDTTAAVDPPASTVAPIPTGSSGGEAVAHEPFPWETAAPTADLSLPPASPPPQNDQPLNTASLASTPLAQPPAANANYLPPLAPANPDVTLPPAPSTPAPIVDSWPAVEPSSPAEAAPTLPPAFPPAPTPPPPAPAVPTAVIPDNNPLGPTPRPAGPADQPVELPLGNADVSIPPTAPPLLPPLPTNPIATEPASTPVATVGATLPVAPIVAQAPIGAPATPVGTVPSVQAPAVAEDPKRKSPIMIWLIVIAVITVLAVGGWFLIGQNQLSQQSNLDIDGGGIPALDQTGTPIEEALPNSGTIGTDSTGSTSENFDNGAILPNP